jgi:hypothetical protein
LPLERIDEQSHVSSETSPVDFAINKLHQSNNYGMNNAATIPNSISSIEIKSRSQDPHHEPMRAMRRSMSLGDINNIILTQNETDDDDNNDNNECNEIDDISQQEKYPIKLTVEKDSGDLVQQNCPNSNDLMISEDCVSVKTNQVNLTYELEKSPLPSCECVQANLLSSSLNQNTSINAISPLNQINQSSVSSINSICSNNSDFIEPPINPKLHEDFKSCSKPEVNVPKIANSVDELNINKLIEIIQKSVHSFDSELIDLSEYIDNKKDIDKLNFFASSLDQYYKLKNLVEILEKYTDFFNKVTKTQQNPSEAK